jgi:hypothetical protein
MHSSRVGRMWYQRFGPERGWSAPSRQEFDAMCGPVGAFLLGDPATVASKMRDASDTPGGVSRITFQMRSASVETTAMKTRSSCSERRWLRLSGLGSSVRQIGDDRSDHAYLLGVVRRSFPILREIPQTRDSRFL